VISPADAHLELTVPAAPSAAGQARRAVRGRGLVDSEREPTLLLLVSELVTNSVRHAGMDADDRIRVRARAVDERAYVEVCDPRRAQRTPRMREPSLDELRPGGLGLQLVDAMADRWGVTSHEHETCVWFELSAGT
jgi:anti-sigma regulatory factor (Ser/Thr protein kinase)